ncbi:MAG: PEP-CTERM sorting domain-containing protein [Myxococcota bacterium]|nr:PEP-CTERM sorting domain-containing protein [Myxococcota bacterium]
MHRVERHGIRAKVRHVLGALGLTLFVSTSAEAAPILNIDEFTWDSATGVASVSGSFDLDSYTGDRWRLTYLEIQVGVIVYSTSLAPYPEFTSTPFAYAFDDVAITPAALTVGNAYQVGITMQRYFDFMSGWDSGTTFRNSTVVTAVPEPNTALLVGFGLAALALRRSHTPSASA